KNDIFHITHELERRGHEVAVIYESLPPGTKLLQAQRFNDPNDPCKIMVATDAIGMGLNLSIKRIIFYSLLKPQLNEQGEKEKDTVTTSQALQIAGRAGRFASAFPDGEVTTFRRDDLLLLKDIVSRQVETIKRAGLHPTAEQIEMFAYHLPKHSLSSLIDIFVVLSQLDDSLFFMCNVEDVKFLADIIEHVPLPLRARYTFSCAPINKKMPFVCTMFLKYARQFSRSEPTTFDWLAKQIGWPFEIPNTIMDLVHLEEVFDCLDLYLWLSFRFADMFPDKELIRGIQAELDQIIHAGVQNIVKLIHRTNRLEDAKDVAVTTSNTEKTAEAIAVVTEEIKPINKSSSNTATIRSIIGLEEELDIHTRNSSTVSVQDNKVEKQEEEKLSTTLAMNTHKVLHSYLNALKTQAETRGHEFNETEDLIKQLISKGLLSQRSVDKLEKQLAVFNDHEKNILISHLIFLNFIFYQLLSLNRNSSLSFNSLIFNTYLMGQNTSIKRLSRRIGDSFRGDRNSTFPNNDEKRIITINSGPQPAKFISNRISTSKYSILTFLPKFLFEQFRKYSNIFFLCIVIFQQIPGVSPTGRYTTAVPLTFILCCAAIKEIIEDVKRHIQDDAVNRRKVLIYRQGTWKFTAWHEVKVGDIVKVIDKEYFPADLVLISSGEPNSICYIQTSNLDGETNLKVRQGLPQTAHIKSSLDLKDLQGTVECELPNRNLYEFAGTLKINSAAYPIPLGADQILLRGSQLKNTTWIYGIVIYSGQETKLMMNSSSVPLKQTHVEKVTNKQILFLLLLLIILCVFSTMAEEIWTSKNKEKHWYLGLNLDENRGTWQHIGYTFLTFFILFNNLIPISLQITVDLVKFIQAYFINWDRDMYDPETDTPASARTSNLNEELGQVKYIFSDKTGTLTKNEMVFKQCSIGGIMYGSGNLSEFNSYELLKNLEEHNTSNEIREFLTLLATCHTVVPENKTHTDLPTDVFYQASSPDEYALVTAMKQMGVVFFSRTPESVTINFRGNKEEYQILNVLEFSSDRKRMSVIIQTSRNEIKLYCKGADSVIMERLGSNDHSVQLTSEHLESFANDGLRTLCLAYRMLTNEEYNEWLVKYREASTAINNRNELVAEVADRIEQNLILLGATGIEDKLQDQVPQSLTMLHRAGIKIWVLTGDKKETAVNIGYSCKLLSDQMLNLTLDETTRDDTQRQLRQHCQQFGDSLRKENPASLVIEGKTLKYALHASCRQDFLDVAMSCKTVICCRVSPKQKAEVVELVKKSTEAITLAIGDGANDVGMIQMAHVGVGILGREGVQAACASDYTIGQFRFLTKLLFVHGVWSYRRLCKVILYSFYKNICLYVMELWFAFHSAFSGQILFERWTIAIYNVIFTAAPPMALGLLDRSCSAETMMHFPAIYKMSQNRSDFNIKIFWTWCLNAVYHSIVLYFMSYFMLRHDVAYRNGQVGTYLLLGNMIYTYVIFVVCLKAGLESDSWTSLTHVAIWGSIASWFIFFSAYSYVWPTLPVASEMRGMAQYVFSSPYFWFGLILIPITTLLADFIYNCIQRTYFKTLMQEVQEKEVAHQDPSDLVMSRQPKTVSRVTERLALLKNVFVRTKATKSTGIIDKPYCGFAFSQEENGVVPQDQLIRNYDTNIDKPLGL
ncbi:unnamed protein product, partial [Rotaria sordida]